MAFKRKETPADPAPRKRRATPAKKAEPKAETKKVEEPVEEGVAEEAAPKKETKKGGIKPSGGGIKPTSGKNAAPEQPAEENDIDPDDLSWTMGGDEARARAEAEAADRDKKQEERKAKVYWPFRFGLTAPTSDKPDNYQSDIIILDANVGPRYYEHMMENPRNGFRNVPEPCPKEIDNCPICPPNGERESYFVMLLTVLNLSGYTRKKGQLAGTHIPVTKDLLALYASDHAYIYKLLEEHGSLRGIQLKMVRKYSSQVRYGIPEFVEKHDDEAIEAYIKSVDMWKPDTTLEGEVKNPDPGHLAKPFEYAGFLKKPNALDLRTRYSGAPGGGNNIGGSDGDQWGNGAYNPNGQAGGGGKLPGFDQSLSDDVPF